MSKTEAQFSKEELGKKLCFVANSFAYFVDDFEGVTGDDWDDMYYQDNAGEPYDEFNPTMVYYEGAAFTPGENIWSYDKSVDYINEGKDPWLKSIGIEFYAGDTLENFIKFIQKVEGGKCYKLVEVKP